MRPAFPKSFKKSRYYPAQCERENPIVQAIFFILTGSVLIGSLVNYFNLSAQSDSENPPFPRCL